jgi:GNAT superfamily N-acetyltransferase
MTAAEFPDLQRLLETGHPLHRRAETVIGASRLSIRPVLPTDANAIATFHRGQSPRSRYLRFHAPIARLTAAQLASIVDVDHHDAETLIAEVGTGRRRRLVGIAQYVCVGNGRADAAVTVDDAWQHRGIGRRLMTALAAAAREAGITAFSATILADNKAALHLVHGLTNPVTTALDGPAYVMEIPLRAA